MVRHPAGRSHPVYGKCVHPACRPDNHSSGQTEPTGQKVDIFGREDVDGVMTLIFINYRIADSRSYGALLYLELSRRFGADQVFLDHESIPAGSDFGECILRSIRRASTLLAVIGSDWLALTGPDGSRQIDDPADWIHRELAEALSSGVRVIPVLTDGSSLPSHSDLPADIAALSRCQFRQLRHHDASADLDRIVADLATTDPELAAAARQQTRRCSHCHRRTRYAVRTPIHPRRRP
jgi:hypothetical protein